MENTQKTLAQIQKTIRIAGDYAWVITDEIEKLTAGGLPYKENKENINRNVQALNSIVADTEIVNSGEDISHLISAIAMGEAKLAENIWPAEDEEPV